MSATTESANELRKALARREHPCCVVCAEDRPDGWGVAFRVEPDGSVAADVPGDLAHQGYRGMLHGGMISTLADGAMTHCLFACGIRAVTAELQVRFRHPVRADRPVRVRAWITRRAEPLFVLQAELEQDSQCMVRATGKFMQTPEESV